MSKTVTDSQKISWQIRSLNSLKNIVDGMNWVKDDVGECGGAAIKNIEETQDLLIEMKNAYYKLLQNTISYMNERNLSIQTKDTDAVGKLY